MDHEGKALGREVSGWGPRRGNGERRWPGVLIINADDWGRNHDTTERIVECAARGSISSVSAMVFMADSDRAAGIACERRIDAGLHLNLTTAFSARGVPSRLIEKQERLSRYLRSHRLAQAIFHPALAGCCEYVVRSQLDEYRRLYGLSPERIDGHHHMHLCANVLLSGLLPTGTILRRNFTFQAREVGALNRLYRRTVDRQLARRNRLVDLFFSLSPLDPRARLDEIAALATQFTVEVAAHPVKPDEYRFLAGGEIFDWAGDLRIADSYSMPDGTKAEADDLQDCPQTQSSDSAARRVAENVQRREQRVRTEHICVCVCTYKRPHLLKRLLEKLNTQDTEHAFEYSVVIVDNDHLCSAEATVKEFPARFPITYCVEPRQNIALARNKAIANALGDFVAFIDDDEFPESHWLLQLLAVANRYGVAGVLGPVKRHFDEAPPGWLSKSKFYVRPTHPTGFVVGWKEARTGNVLLNRRLFASTDEPFRQEFRAGEDQDFFRRMTELGHVFVWCNEAVVYETVPPVRWKRAFMLKKALLRGATARLQPGCGALSIAKSIIAVFCYGAALPITLMLGHHRVMTLLVKLFDHLGKVLAAMGINPIKEPYVTE